MSTFKKIIFILTVIFLFGCVGEMDTEETGEICQRDFVCQDLPTWQNPYYYQQTDEGATLCEPCWSDRDQALLQGNNCCSCGPNTSWCSDDGVSLYSCSSVGEIERYSCKTYCEYMMYDMGDKCVIKNGQGRCDCCVGTECLNR
ncbi:MAG: hypothetical protein PHY40_00925 [Patescibacteria group bacterium]|nr:hypothetical protein [Patescibacteria group bacterium]